MKNIFKDLFKKKTKKKSLDEKIFDTNYELLKNTLTSILSTEVKKTDSEGNEKPDWGTTVSVIRTKARLTLDFINGLKKE